LTDWATIGALATAGGTLVLAAATYSSVRSANRTARIAERSLLLGLRPVLIQSRPEDAAEKVRWAGAHSVQVRGGTGRIDVENGVVYMAIALRNVGTGLAVLQGWHVEVGRATADGDHPEPEQFIRQRRDLYIAAADTGFWQAALRDPEDELTKRVIQAEADEEQLTVYLLYGDHEGGQLTISMFGLSPREGGEWTADIGRHWTLGAPDPRMRPE
jgi:hypothetical protein